MPIVEILAELVSLSSRCSEDRKPDPTRACLGAEDFARVGTHLPETGAESDVTGDVGGIVEHQDGFAWSEFAAPIEAATGHRLVSADGEIEGDGAFAEAPHARFLFCEDRADRPGA